jgi:hypothetical protein
MPTSSETHIVLVSDISGSMSSMGNIPCNELNKLIKEQKGDVTFDCWSFNDEHKLLFQDLNASEANISDLVPSGGTALYGSLGYIIDKTGEKLANMPQDSRPKKVMIVIYTDGEENSSKDEYKGENGRLLVKSKIEHQQSVYSWVFMFLGSNIDAEKNGTSIGITSQTCINYTSSQKGYTAVFRSASQAVDRLRSVAPEDRSEIIKRVAFTDEEKEESIDYNNDVVSNNNTISNNFCRISSNAYF